MIWTIIALALAAVSAVLSAVAVCSCIRTNIKLGEIRLKKEDAPKPIKPIRAVGVAHQMEMTVDCAADDGLNRVLGFERTSDGKPDKLLYDIILCAPEQRAQPERHGILNSVTAAIRSMLNMQKHV